MHKIAVIGDRESVTGFAAIGMQAFIVSDKINAAKTLKELAADDYAIIFITEAVASEISAEIERYNSSVTPAIILIPGVSGNTGEGMSSVSKQIEKAVGSQLIN